MQPTASLARTPPRRPWAPGVALAAVLALGLPAWAAPGASRPEELTYLTEDYPPSNFLVDGQLKGIAVEVLKLIWKRMGVAEQPIQVINWARGYRQTEETPGLVLFAMTRTPERDPVFKWVGPIYHSAYVLVGRSGQRFQLERTLDAAHYRVGVLRQDIGHKLLLQAGVPDAGLEKVSHVRQLVQMLVAGRVDLICLPEETMHQYVLEEKLAAGSFNRAFVVWKSTLAFAFNKDTDPGLIERFQTALDHLGPERERIIRKYGGMP